jgi:hypothetical protein
VSGFDQLEYELRAAERRLNAAERTRIRRQPTARNPGAVLTVAAGALVAIVVAVVALSLHDHRPARPLGPTALPRIHTLTGELGVLREPQTPADRAFNHGAYLRDHALAFRHAHTRLVPPLTRAVRLSDGREIYLYVVRVTHAGRSQLQLGSTVRIPHGYSGAERLTPSTMLTPVPPIALRQGSGRNPFYEIVPDGVAAVSWSVPRQPWGASFGPTYPHPITVRVEVHQNVAAGVLSGVGIPTVITWYAADGSLIARAGNPAALSRITTGPTPVPETALTRRAERDPVTPNPLTATPAVGDRHTIIAVHFTVLIESAGYRFVVTGGPHPGCAPSYGADIWSNPADVRGRTFTIDINPRSSGWCPGVYHITAAVNGARPFGTTSITIR